MTALTASLPLASLRSLERDEQRGLDDEQKGEGHRDDGGGRQQERDRQQGDEHHPPGLAPPSFLAVGFEQRGPADGRPHDPAVQERHAQLAHGPPEDPVGVDVVDFAGVRLVPEVVVQDRGPRVLPVARQVPGEDARDRREVGPHPLRHREPLLFAVVAERTFTSQVVSSICSTTTAASGSNPSDCGASSGFGLGRALGTAGLSGMYRVRRRSRQRICLRRFSACEWR